MLCARLGQAVLVLTLMRGGLARAKGFDWVRMAERTLDVLTHAAGG